MGLSEQGHWTIPQSINWILSGNRDLDLPDGETTAEDAAFAVVAALADGEPADHPPPFDTQILRREVDQIIARVLNGTESDIIQFINDACGRSRLREYLERAEKALVGDLQMGRITALGRLQTSFDIRRPVSICHAKIPSIEILGEVILPKWPWAPSWLLARFGSGSGADRIWCDVRIPVKRLKRLYPEPLIKVNGVTPGAGGLGRRPEGSDSDPEAWSGHRPVVADRKGKKLTAERPPACGDERAAPDVTKPREERQVCRGRRPKYDWSPILTGLRKLLEENGYPEPGSGDQAQLEAWTAEQFDPDSQPSESLIRQKVSEAIKAFQQDIGVKADK